MNSHVKLEDISQNPSGQIRTMVTLCIWVASYLFQQLSFFSYIQAGCRVIALRMHVHYAN